MLFDNTLKLFCNLWQYICNIFLNDKLTPIYEGLILLPMKQNNLNMNLNIEVAVIP
jgi:hypothetical protein